MKSKIAAAGVAFALAATALGLAAGPASAASGPRATATIERLPGSAVPWAGTAGTPPPATCVKAQTSPTFTAASRLDWCAVFAAVLTVYEGTKQVGKADVDQTDYASWKVSSRTWNPTRQVFGEVGPGSGVLEGQPLTVTGTSTCSGGCTVTANGSYTLPVPHYPYYSEKDPKVTSMGTATVTGSLTTSWIYEGDGLAFPPLSETTVGVRCDSIYPGYRYKAGCANPSFTPTYVLSSSKYPDIAKFDKAEIAKHPSWSTLTRVSPAQADKNRKIACKGFKKRSPTDSCDEFPYASTTQGGAEAAQEHVNIHENTSQGNNLGAFYNANRLFYGEKFHVKIS
jgi:Deoxyribonuclease NucA/NucB